jgi:putative transcriptional regulator
VADGYVTAKVTWHDDKWPCWRVAAEADPQRMSSRTEPLRTRLRVARAERGLSQEQLARAVGVSRQTISSIEIGQYCPSTLLALRLARALDAPFDALFWLEGDTR